MDENVSAVVVLAAGQGTRMRSATPKVLHMALGRSLLAHVLASTASLLAARTLVVVGHGREEVTTHLAQVAPAATPVVQQRQGGTGDAVRVALAAVPDLAGTVLVLPGDSPLLTPQSLAALLARHRGEQAAATLLTAEPRDPTGYGRVLRDDAGRVAAVVEHRDASPAQRAVREVGTSVYAFEAGALRAVLARVTADNAAGELYLTDAVALLVADGATVAAHRLADPAEGEGVNDRVQLAAAADVLRHRVLRAHLLAGVAVLDPATTWVDVDVVLAPDAVVEPFTVLKGATVVESGAVVGPSSRLTDCVVRAGATVTASTCVGADIGPGATVGPYSYLRPGTVLGARAKVGAFVEIKASTVGEGSKVPHLSYVGDATIGARSNIGAATVVVNYDGRDKHKTVVGDDVRVGSDTMLVAPVTVGDGAYTAAGSVITSDVPAGALGVGRARQRNVEGWVARRRGRPAVPNRQTQDPPQPDGEETPT